MLAWLQRVGQFTAHHALIVTFTVLLLFFLYRNGERIAEELRSVLRETFVNVERYLDVATRAVQGSLNSMVIVGLCDGLATTVAFALIGDWAREHDPRYVSRVGIVPERRGRRPKPERLRTTRVNEPSVSEESWCARHAHRTTR